MISIDSIQKGHVQDLQWLTECIQIRCKQTYALKNNNRITTSPDEIDSIYEQMLLPFTYDERLILIMALANDIYPQVWGAFAEAITDYKLDENDIDSFGLVQIDSSKCLQATISTALFLLGGPTAKQQSLVWQWFLPHRLLRTQDILDLPNNKHLPSTNTLLKLNQAFLLRMLTGQSPLPQYSPDFPATPLTTSKTWDDLILDEYTTTLLAQARKWVRHYVEVSKQPGVHQGQGYRLLMSGPSGTGKTLAAALLGKEAGKPVYRIDISNIVDKYVGETSKKLRQIFEVAEAQDWILFFDEGDALFGKRSEGGQSSNERYANQEVSYLLYKLEEYQGMIFLATNHRKAIDTAFMRRFDSLIRFYSPDQYTRQQLWAHFFDKPRHLQLANTINQANWRELAERAEVSAAWIEKFYAYCVMQTTAKSDPHISAQEMRLYLHWFGAERGYFEDKTRDLFLKNYN